MRIVSLMLTWQCNLNCTYCFEAFKRNDRTMTAGTARKNPFVGVRRLPHEQRTGKRRLSENRILRRGNLSFGFDVIREVTEWIETLDLPFKTPVVRHIERYAARCRKQAWFTARKERIRIVLSVDGTQHYPTGEPRKGSRSRPARLRPPHVARPSLQSDDLTDGIADAG